MKNEFLLAIGQLAAEKNLPRDIVFDAVEAALTSAYRREGENAPNVYVKVDPETGDIHAYMQKSVVEEVEEPNLEIAVGEAQRYKRDARAGDVLDFEMKIPENAGRIAAQTAKQVVLQRLREAERDAVYDEYAGKEGEIVVGTVQRVEPRQAIVELGKGTEASLPYSEQVRNEHLRSGQRVKVIILRVERAAKGPQVIVSRSHRSLLRRLFELEVPEIANGSVEIKSIAREGGHRSKVAVHSRVASVDPIGACVGMRGGRIQNIVNELSGERIDVIKWDPDPANFVSNALSPAQVLEAEIDLAERRASVVVPDRMLSLAIGKEGQNARLAAKLTGWRIDIRSQAASERAAQGLEEAPSSFEPFAPGEEPDIDIIEEAEEVAAAAAAATQPLVTVPIAPAPAPAPAVQEGTEEEEFNFAAALAQTAVPDREEREAEDYGEEEAEEDEEYEVPTMVVPEARPTAIRFAEDVLPKRPEEQEEAAKKGAKKVRRAPRFAESEDEMEEIDYSGRIH
ncbi:MAG: transcription termination/antitermination protein NusA [Dehalococcoidia bacterium]|nr:transcription termination/antitermination protein NusA [Dehalococcoidia bacterium]